MNILLIIFVALLVLKLGVELWLEKINAREVASNKGKIPPAFKAVVDQETYDKSTSYTLEKIRFGVLEMVYDSAILALVVLTGILPWLYYLFTGWFGTGIWGQALVMFALMIVLMIPSLPTDWWTTFKIEAKFGFNKSTLGLWLSDKVKGFALSLVIGIPILALLLWFFKVLPDTWWIWGFVAFFGIQLLLMVLYPRLIMPLFNKLEPLPAGDLRERLLALGERTGFTASTIHVMDGSKRSTHSNAFFTGFGKFRRIVLYDTLVEQLTPVELEAVLAHEIGHYKKGHIPKMLVVSGISSLLGFGIIAWLAKQPLFFEAFGFRAEDGMVPALILFSMASGLVTFWMTPLFNKKSRKHEYEADAFAKAAMNGDPEPLVSSLRKMYEKNLSNLTPHPIYSGFHYSHPTLLEREAALKNAS